MRKLLTGNHAVAWGARLARPKVVPVYPITPQTPVPELLTEFQAAGELDAEILTPESEHSVMAACIPASLAGVRVFTATASQGLMLMHEVLHYASGARAPIVMANVNRTIASPWAFWPDQTDSLAQLTAVRPVIFSLTSSSCSAASSPASSARPPVRSTVPLVMPVTFSSFTRREAIERWMPFRMSGVAMPRETMLMTSVSASTAQIELTFSGFFEVCDSGPISSTATPR